MLPAQPRAGRVQPSRCHTAFENRASAPEGAQLAACPYSPTASTSHLFAFAPQPVRQCGAQVLSWRMPMDAEQYEVYADALFGAAADVLLAPPMQDES